MRLFLTILIFALTSMIFLALPLSAADESEHTLSPEIQKFSFLNMRGSDKLIVKREFFGCFSNGKNPTMTFSAQSAEIDGLGQFYIEDEDLLKLDRYWSVITDSKRRGGCTSVNFYDVTLIRGGHTVATGNVSDAFCGSFTSLPYNHDRESHEYTAYQNSLSQYLSFGQLERIHTETAEIR